MEFLDPLIKGKLIKRYKRFMADVELENGDVVTAHCANSGSMKSVNEPGSEVWISPARNPDRKLKFTWELLRVGDAWVGVNTAHPNKLVFDAIADGTIMHNRMPSIGRRRESEFYILINLICHKENSLPLL